MRTAVPVASASYVSGASSISLLGETIGGHFTRTAARFRHREALVDRPSGRVLTYEQLSRDVDAVALGLHARGVARGDRVGLLAPNSADWTTVQYATARLGAILVGIDPSCRTHELEYVLNHARVNTLIASSAFRTSDYAAMIDDARGNGTVLRDVVFFDQPQWTELLEAGRASDPATLARIESCLSPDDPACIRYPACSTGYPKGVTLSHHSILNNGYFTGHLLDYTEHDRVCIPVSFHLCFGTITGVVAALSHGACVVIPAETFDPGATLAACAEHRATSLFGLPSMFIAELSDPSFGTHDLASLRTGVVAGTACPPELRAEITDGMGLESLVVCQGTPEATGVVAQTRVHDRLERRFSAAGRVHPHLEVKIVDPATGMTVPRREPGSLHVRGYSVMRGYWDQPRTTSDVIDDAGWLRTGDLAVMDDDGGLIITGRLADVVIRDGDQIDPREIEQVLYSHPDVVDVHVAGVPDPAQGQEVMCWIRQRAGTEVLDAAKVRAFCQGRLDEHKIPRQVKIVEDLPPRPGHAATERSFVTPRAFIGPALRDQLLSKRPADSPQLHREASAWYAAHGDLVGAFQQAELSGDGALVADLLRTSWLELGTADPRRVHRLLMSLSAAERQTDPELLLALAWCWSDPDTDVWTGSRLLRAAFDAQAPTSASSEARQLMLATAFELRQAASRGAVDDTTLAEAERLTDTIDELAREADPQMLAAAVALLAYYGAARLLKGDLARAVAVLRSATNLAVLADVPNLRKFCRAHEAIALVLLGEVRRAESLLTHVESQTPGPVPQAAMTLAWALTRLEEGETAEARGLLDSVCRNSLPSALMPVLVHAEALADLLAGDDAQGLERVRHWRESGVSATPYLRSLVLGVETVISGPLTATDEVATGLASDAAGEWLITMTSWAHLRSDRGGHALEGVRPILDTDVPRPSRVRVDLLAQAAAICLELGDHDAALRHAERMLGRTELSGSVRAVHLLPRPVLAALLVLVELRSNSSSSRALATAMRERLGMPRGSAGRDLGLSRRETAVLGQLASTRSLTEIASMLFVSPNTLKTQVRSIYRKLGVASRADAVEVAKRLGTL